MYKLLILSLAVLTLSGCAISESRMNTAAAPIIENARREMDSTKSEIKSELASKVAESQNAIQSNVNSLIGGAIGKLGDTVKGLELNLKDLVHLNATMNNQMNNKIDKIETSINNKLEVNNQMIATVKAELKAEVNANVNNNMQATIQAQNKMIAELKAEIRAELKAELKVEAEARATAQVGLQNTISEMKTTLTNDLKAGRDVNQTQFTKEMLYALQTSNYLTFGMGILFVVVIVILTIYNQHKDSKRYKEENDRRDLNTRQMMALVATRNTDHSGDVETVEKKS